MAFVAGKRALSNAEESTAPRRVTWLIAATGGTGVATGANGGDDGGGEGGGDGGGEGGGEGGCEGGGEGGGLKYASHAAWQIVALAAQHPPPEHELPWHAPV